MSLCRIIVEGTVGKDAELKTFNSGKNVLEFSLGHHPASTSDTDWYDVKVWGKYGETLEGKLTKGTIVVVDGRQKLRRYTTKAGEARVSIEVSADSVTFMRRSTPESELGATVESETPNGSVPF
jgi:single-strand DNA-binding protein